MATIVQTATNSVAKAGPGDWGSAVCTATFPQPTTPGSMIVAVATVTGGLSVGHRLSSSSFTEMQGVFYGDLGLAAYYRAAAPATTSLSFSTDAYRGINLRLIEVQGVAQANPLDKFVWDYGYDDYAGTGDTGTLAGNNEFVLGMIANQYASTTQYGFSGGLTRLYETVIPDSSNQDWERGRITIHTATPNTNASRYIEGNLSTYRRWISFLATFKSGITGPVKLSTTRTTTALSAVSGHANLTVFGRLKVTTAGAQRALSGVAATRARIGPFDYQYRFGGWSGLLVGANTAYPVESVEGLEGWTVRTADADMPRSDGAMRGVDLQAARQVLFKMATTGTRSQVEAAMTALFAALTPQRDGDLELIWRHPGRPLRSLYYRPTDLVRLLNRDQAVANKQGITLRAADPRHYSAVIHTVKVPIATDDTDTVNVVSAINAGNARAYPIIRVTGPTSGPDVSRITLVNASADVSFDVLTTLPSKAELVGDMLARIAAVQRSVVTLNGQSRYGAWQQPREAFYLAPDPVAGGGVNLLYARTVPTGAPVTCTIEYRDTWSG